MAPVAAGRLLVRGVVTAGIMVADAPDLVAVALVALVGTLALVVKVDVFLLALLAQVAQAVGAVVRPTFVFMQVQGEAV